MHVRRFVVVLALGSAAGLLAGCGGGADRVTNGDPPPTPTAVPTSTPTPGPTRGRIPNLTAARDIVRYNQETPHNPGRGVICRWELPVRVYIEPPTRRDLVIEALDHWKAFADTEYVLVDSPAIEPVLHVREDDAIVPAGASGIGGVQGTYANNRARRGFVVVRPGRLLRKLYRHEVGHALGFLDHPEDPGLMCTFSGCRDEVTPREGSMMAHLYTIPHGARLSTDGSWEVVLREGPTFVRGRPAGGRAGPYYRHDVRNHTNT